MLAGIFIPGPSTAEVDAFTQAQRACAPAGVAADMLDVYYRTDVRALLPQVRARTVVLHREADPATGFQLGQEVAALVPGAGSASRCSTTVRAWTWGSSARTSVR